jgi:hypothetical protein
MFHSRPEMIAVERSIGQGARKMRTRCALILATSIAALLVYATPAAAAQLAVSPDPLVLSTPVGTTTEATLTITNAGDEDIELTGAFLTYKPFLTPGAAHGQENALSFFTEDCGLRILAPGESCSYTVVFQPGVLDDPDPEPGTKFRGRIVQETTKGKEIVRFTATAT